MTTNKADGISIRLIRSYQVETDKFPTVGDIVWLSCRWLGHTYDHNPLELVCTVCGAKKPLGGAGV